MQNIPSTYEYFISGSARASIMELALPKKKIEEKSHPEAAAKINRKICETVQQLTFELLQAIFFCTLQGASHKYSSLDSGIHTHINWLYGVCLNALNKILFHLLY